MSVFPLNLLNIRINLEGFCSSVLIRGTVNGFIQNLVLRICWLRLALIGKSLIKAKPNMELKLKFINFKCFVVPVLIIIGTLGTVGIRES